MKTKAISSIFLLFTIAAGIISMSPASFAEGVLIVENQFLVLVLVQVVNLQKKDVTIQVLQQLVLVVL